MSIEEAMEWLLLHPTEDAAPDSESQSVAPEHTPSQSQTSMINQIESFSVLSAIDHDTSQSLLNADAAATRPKISSRSSDNTDSPSQSASRRQSKAQTILESFRAYKRRKFKPNLIVRLSHLLPL